MVSFISLFLSHYPVSFLLFFILKYKFEHSRYFDRHNTKYVLSLYYISAIKYDFICYFRQNNLLFLFTKSTAWAALSSPGGRGSAYPKPARRRSVLHLLRKITTSAKVQVASDRATEPLHQQGRSGGRERGYLHSMAVTVLPF